MTYSQIRTLSRENKSDALNLAFLNTAGLFLKTVLLGNRYACVCTYAVRVLCVCMCVHVCMCMRVCVCTPRLLITSDMIQT